MSFVLRMTLGLLFFNSTGFAACPKLSYDELEKLVATEGNKHLVFFATWCASCKESLTSPQPSNTLLIAAFDTQEKAERAIKKFGVTLPCYTDNGITKQLGIKLVPAEYDFKK